MKTMTTTRETVWAAMWANKRYLALHAKKDHAIRTHLQAEVDTRTTPADLAKFARRAKNAIRAIQRFEDAALAAAGV